MSVFLSLFGTCCCLDVVLAGRSRRDLICRLCVRNASPRQGCKTIRSGVIRIIIAPTTQTKTGTERKMESLCKFGWLTDFTEEVDRRILKDNLFPISTLFASLIIFTVMVIIPNIFYFKGVSCCFSTCSSVDRNVRTKRQRSWQR